LTDWDISGRVAEFEGWTVAASTPVGVASEAFRERAIGYGVRSAPR